MRAEMSGSSNKHGEAQLSPAKENIAYFSVLWNSRLYGGGKPARMADFYTFMYPVIGGILMVLTGVLTAQEATKSIPLEMVFLIGGMLERSQCAGFHRRATLIGDAVSKGP